MAAAGGRERRAVLHPAPACGAPSARSCRHARGRGHAGDVGARWWLAAALLARLRSSDLEISLTLPYRDTGRGAGAVPGRLPTTTGTRGTQAVNRNPLTTQLAPGTTRFRRAGMTPE